jgi:hypothetical protein
MKSTNAVFQIGDWTKPHDLTISAVDREQPGLATVSCFCGWSVNTGAEMAKRLGKLHLNQAAARS